MDFELIINFIIILISIIFIIYLLFDSTQNNNRGEHFEIISQESKNKLLKTMEITDKVFTENNLWYIIALGSLLGAVRHHNIIPWDDDIDLFVKHKDLNKLKHVLNELVQQYNLHVETYQNRLFRIYSNMEDKTKFFIDIFIIKSDGDIIHRCLLQEDKCMELNKSQQWFHKSFGFKDEYIKNRKRYKFGNIFVWGPQNPMNLLSFWYGDDCLTTCKTHYLKDHKYVVEQETIDCNIR